MGGNQTVSNVIASLANFVHLLAICMDESSTDWHTPHKKKKSTPSMFAFIQFVRRV